MASSAPDSIYLHADFPTVNFSTCIFLLNMISLSQRKWRKNKSQVPFLNLLIFSTFLLYAMSCQKSLSPEEAKKHLQAFDNEVIQMANGLSQTRGWKSFQEIRSIKGFPDFSLFSNDSLAFEKLKGYYEPDSLGVKYIKTAQADSILLSVPMKDFPGERITFFLKSFSQENTRLGFYFPVLIEGGLIAGNQQLMSINHKGNTRHEFPESGELSIALDNYLLRAGFTTSFRKSSARLKYNLALHKNERPLAAISGTAKTGFSEHNTFELYELKDNTSIFPIILKTHALPKNIPAFTTEFSKEFSKNISMQAFTSTGNKKVGEIQLREKPGSDRLEFVFVYNDGSSEYLEEILLSLKKILNIKV